MTDALVAQQARLIEREAALRQAARIVELNPARQEEAAGMFASASRIRDERLRLARECGLL